MVWNLAAQGNSPAGELPCLEAACRIAARLHACNNRVQMCVGGCMWQRADVLRDQQLPLAPCLPKNGAEIV